MSLRKRALWYLVRIVLIHLSVLGLLLALVAYDLARCTPWILHPTITKVLGWIMALYGLFWIMRWFFWTSIEGGTESVTALGVTWKPVTTPYCTEGPFGWCRYPLAFGYLEFVWGLGFLVQSTTTVLVVVPIATVATILALRLISDRRRLALDPEGYAAYIRRVPILFPRIPDASALTHLWDKRRRRL